MNSTTENELAQKRGQAYGFFAAAMEYPEGELAGLIRSGAIARQARSLLGGIYPELETATDWDALGDAGKDDELSIEYTRLFDVGGTDGPPCCLNSGATKGDSRMGLLEELVRFYNYFGLTAGETEANELPDHLSTQFEFMYYLCHEEAECRQGTDHDESTDGADDFLRAQRDFMERHIGQWVPALSARLEEHHAPRYYLELGRLMARFVQREQARLAAAVGQLKPAQPHAPISEDAPQKKSKVIPITQVSM